MHQRTAIRDYVVALLMGNTSVGSNVFPTLVDGLDEDTQIPGIIVKASEDTKKQKLGDEPVQYQRTLLLKIEVSTAGDEAAVNVICDEVENILLPDIRLGGLATSSELVKTVLEGDGKGNKVYWDGMILIDVDYVSTHE